MNSVKKNHDKIKRITFLAMMFACIVILTMFEHSLPPIPFLPPNMKLGLSNVAVMYCVIFTGGRNGLLLAVLKSFFVFIIRGGIAFVLSISGGICSIFIMVLLLFLFKEKNSYVILSVFGAVFHNLGQLAAFSVIMQIDFAVYYVPVLLIAGIVMGSITGIVVKIILPVMQKTFSG